MAPQVRLWAIRMGTSKLVKPRDSNIKKTVSRHVFINVVLMLCSMYTTQVNAYKLNAFNEVVVKERGLACLQLT